MSTQRVRKSTRQETASSSENNDLLVIVLAICTAIALVVVVPTLILIQPNVGRSKGWMITGIILLISGIRIVFLIYKGERRLFEFIFWLFSYVFFGLAPTTQIRLDEMSTTTKALDPALDTPTALFALFGIVAFALGFQISRRMRSATHRAPSTWSISIPRLVILSFVSVAASLYYVAKTGISVQFSSRAEISDVLTELWPEPSTAAMIGAASAFPILIAAHGWWEVSRQSPKNKGTLSVLAAVLTAMSLFITNPISSARYHFGVVWGSFLGTLGAYRTRKGTSLTLVGIIFGLLFVFPIADMFRRKNVVASARSGFLDEYAGNGDYDAFGQLSNALLFNDTEPLAFGRQMMGSLLFWVPRSIWPDKATGTGVLLAESRGYNFTNLSAPIWAELLLNFGLIGAVIASVFIGILLGRLDNRFIASHEPGVDSIVASVLPFYLLILMRGSLLQATGILVVIIFSILFIGGKRSGHKKHRHRPGTYLRHDYLR